MINYIGRPNLTDAPPWCEYFFSLVDNNELINSLEDSRKITLDLINSIPIELEEYKYAENKWTVKMVFSHIIDCERLYCFNAMCFSRKDNREYADFEQDNYALNSNTANRTLKDLGEEYYIIRDATIKLFNYMTEDMLDFKSMANKFIYTPRSYGWMIAGHNIHHCNIIRERYLKI